MEEFSRKKTFENILQKKKVWTKISRMGWMMGVWILFR